MEVSRNFLAPRSEFPGVFATPSLATLLRLMSGWILTPTTLCVRPRRFVTDLILAERLDAPGESQPLPTFL